MGNPIDQPDIPFAHLVDLAQPRLGSDVVFATDEFFGDKSRLILPTEPVWIDDKYDDNGKWMDGWESRRRRDPGHDWCVLQLGMPGVVRGINIDTRHFIGNFPPFATVQACVSTELIPGSATEWVDIVPRLALKANLQHFVPVNDDTEFTHIKLNIYPDGGVARLRVYGVIQPDWSTFSRDEPVDVLALKHGGRALACNDEHFGTMYNLNAPGRGINMGDGWETRRRRDDGHDWVVLALGHAAHVDEVLIDTAHFKGNYPDRVMLQAAGLPADMRDDEAVAASDQWNVLLPEKKLGPDAEHRFRKSVADIGPVTHLRMNIYPDGGVSRLRILGRLAELAE
ncbi:MAG: allantoicase [Pseudomonadota bacterium]